MLRWHYLRPCFRRLLVNKCSYGNLTVLDAAWSADGDGESDVEMTILFAGYWRDTETGLYHVRHRMYHVRLCLWLTRDPEGYVDGMSLYAYVQCGPLIGTDPLGLWDWEGVRPYAKMMLPRPTVVALDTYALTAPSEGKLAATGYAAAMFAGSILPNNRYYTVGTGYSPEGAVAAAWGGTQESQADFWDRVGHGMIGVGQHLALGLGLAEAFGSPDTSPESAEHTQYETEPERPSPGDEGQQGPDSPRPEPPQYPRNPDDWEPPEGWEETPTGERTKGRHRQWKDQDGNLRRRWDREGPKGSEKERGPHWHDYDDESGGKKHIEPDD